VTDRRTDGRTELRWLRRAESIAAFARKNSRSKLNMSPDPQKIKIVTVKYLGPDICVIDHLYENIILVTKQQRLQKVILFSSTLSHSQCDDGNITFCNLLFIDVLVLK